MPVNFGPYQSVYVNRRSPEIAKVLRDRFVTNFAMQDELQQKLLQLQTAPFAGDEATKKALSEEITQKLESFADRGDYENMTMDIAKTARSYQEKATPLAQNYAMYQADKQQKEKMLAEGKITLADYNRWLKRATKRYDEEVGDYVDYTGVTYDENGKIDSSSFYSPIQIAAYVDVQGEILKQLNQLKEVKEGGDVIKRYETKDGVEYAVTRGGTIKEYVPQDLVNQVTQNVLNRPDVQSYLSQKSEFDYLDADEQTINSIISSEIRDLRATNTPENMQYADELVQTLASGTLGEKRKLAAQSAYNKEVNNYYTMGQRARPRSEYGGRFEMEYSRKYLAGLSNDTAQVPGSSVMIQGTTQDIYSPLRDPDSGQITSGSIDQSIAKAQTSQIQAATLLQGQVPTFRDMPAQDIVSTLGSLTAADVQRLRLEPRMTKIVEEARQAIETQNIIMETGLRIRDKIKNDSGYNPEALTQTVTQSTANEYKLAVDKVPDALVTMSGGQDIETVGLGIATGLAAEYATFPETAPSNDIRRVITESVQSLTGLDLETAENIADMALSKNYESVAPNYSPGGIGGPSNIVRSSRDYIKAVGVEGDALGFIDSYVSEFANQSRKISLEFEEKLAVAGDGKVAFGEVNFLSKNEKKIADEIKGALEGRNLLDLGAISGMDGETSLQRLVTGKLDIDPADIMDNDGAVLQELAVSKVTLTRGLTKDGAVRPALGLTFTRGSGSDKIEVPGVFKVPYDQVVKMDGGLGQKLAMTQNTPAHKVIDRIYTQIAAAPALMEDGNGVTTVYRDQIGNDFVITFVPSIDASGVVSGFSQIVVDGQAANGHVVPNIVFASVPDFINAFNATTASNVQ